MMKVFLQSQARSRSSMMMDVLQRGGVPCEYNADNLIERQRTKYRNAHGFFEITGSPTQEKCFKSLGIIWLKRIPKDVKVIYLVRDFDQLCKSWKQVIPLWNRQAETAKVRDDIERELIGRPVLRIRSEDMVSNPRQECERIKEFLKGDFDFNFEEAVKGVDTTLTVIR